MPSSQLGPRVVSRHRILPGAPLVALVALVALAACSFSESSPDTAHDAGHTADSAHPRPELLNRVTNAYPAWSPDGRWIAYMSTADGDFDVYAVNDAHGERRQLTDAPDRDGTPVYSPDGKRIAFQSFRDGHSQVYVMNSNGTDQHNVTRSDFHDEHPCWSADGKRLLFASDRTATLEAPDNIDIFELDLATGDVRQITDTPEVETYPSWSPDGTRITVRRIMPDGDWEVVVMDADGANARTIAPHAGADGWPAWSPDGTRLAFASERAGTADLYLYDLATDGLTRLTWDDEADERQPAFSPDGQFVAYARYVWFPGQPFYEASEIYVVRVGGGSRP